MAETGQFLETVVGEFNRMRARAFSDGYEGVTHAGIAIVAADTGYILFAQRAMDETDAPDVAQTWEFPGGGLNEGEEPFPGAVRELLEETYLPLPDGMVVNGWRSPDGVYQGFVYLTPEQFPLDGWTPTTEVQAVGWFTPQQIMDSGKMRPELADTPWALLDATSYGREADTMDDTGDTVDTALDAGDEAEAYSSIPVQPIPLHGVVAPEDTETGDSRAFKAGSMTARPLRLPFRHAKSDIGGHDGAITVGSMDRIMRSGGLIHWEGSLMPTEEGDDFAGMLAFFGQYGVSVDGDKGSLDSAMSSKTGVLWFDAVRAAGLTAVAIPAFHEAYVAFGPHPDMPDDTLVASADASQNALQMVGQRVTFDRGPGFYTAPGQRIHDYWTKKGQPGYAKVAWGTPGDFARAKALIGAKIAEHSPTTLKYLNQIIAQWHHDALGYWPATHAKMDRAGVSAATADHASKEVDTSLADKPAWEAVLTSSAGAVVRPPMSYFERQENAENCIIEDPDANGIRHTYGYAAEWGVCHIGKDGRCVEAPEGKSGQYPEFHLGRTRLDTGEYIKTGLITYGVEHRDADTVLSQTATQAHFDDLSHAWAAVRVGDDDRGIWFSGVVLPTVTEDWITTIEASGQVSGEWLYGEMRTILTVNVPGYPVMASSAVYNDEGEVLALVASAFGGGLCAPSPAERMAAMREIDAETRLASLRAEIGA